VSETRSSLLNRIKDLADGPSWEEFDRIYRRLLVHYALSRGLNQDEAEDIAQQCMASLAEGVQNFTRQVSFRGWLRGMVDRKVTDQLRKRKHEVPARTRDLQGEQATEENPALAWERQWNRTHLLYWLNQIRTEIAPLTYTAFELYVVQERPVAEITARLGMTPNQIYLAKHRVLGKLKERWAALDNGIL
jgi:RNA polymerase sigma-70 factor, ECF subfamily